jgi:uncharacterized protein (TIGR02147 family)
LETLALKNFRGDCNVVARRLRRKVTPEQVKLAFSRLETLGLVFRDDQLGFRRGTGNPVLKDEVASEAIKNHHREMMINARDALREQSIEERDFRVTKLAILKKDYPIAKDLIRECHRSLQKLSVNENADDVYAFDTQFFKLTETVESCA